MTYILFEYIFSHQRFVFNFDFMYFCPSDCRLHFKNGYILDR